MRRRRWRLSSLSGGRGPAPAAADPTRGGGRGRVRRAELPARRRRSLLGPRAPAAHPRSAYGEPETITRIGDPVPDVPGWRCKFGAIGPSTNTVVQPDFDAMRPLGVTTHNSRIYTP